MKRDPSASLESELQRSDVRAGLTVSIQSAVWTIIASSAAVALGVSSRTAVLVAFGAIGFVDAVGSLALVYHFWHGLRHDKLSEELEKLAHRVVLFGLFFVGCAAIAGGVARLTTNEASNASNAGVTLAAISLVALVALSARKQSVARRVSSPALLSDGHLSAIGAVQAAVTLAGTAATRWIAWNWADAAATTVVGCGAATLAVLTWSAEARRRRTFTSSWTLPRAAVTFVTAVAIADALLGQRVVLIGLLVAGPAVAAVSTQPRATAFVSAWSIVLAVMLGAPDHIWLTWEHAVWVSAVALVGVVNSVATMVVARRRDDLQTLASWRSTASR